MIQSFTNINKSIWLWCHIQSQLNLHEKEQEHKGDSQKWNKLVTNHNYHLHEDSKVIVETN
jgi:hypothetical protein